MRPSVRVEEKSRMFNSTTYEKIWGSLIYYDYIIVIRIS